MPLKGSCSRPLDVDRINLVGKFRNPALAEQHGSLDPLLSVPTGLHLESDRFKARAHKSQHSVARQAVDLCGIDLVGNVTERSDDAQHPLLRHRRRRVAAPDRILPHAQSSAASASSS
jgi:hypothetical protein